MLVSVSARLSGTGGQAALEYAGVLVVIAAVLMSVIELGVAHRVAGSIEHDVTCIFAGRSCSGHTGPGSVQVRLASAHTGPGSVKFTADSAHPGAGSNSGGPLAHADGPPADAMFAQRSSYFTGALHYCQSHPNQRYHPDTSIKGSGWIQCKPYLKDLSLGKFSIINCIKYATGVTALGKAYSLASKLNSASAEATIEDAGAIVKEVGESVVKDFSVYASVIACAQGGQGN